MRLPPMHISQPITMNYSPELPKSLPPSDPNLESYGKVSKDLAELAHKGIEQIVASNEASRLESNKRLRNATVIFIASAIVFIIFQLVISEFQQRRITDSLGRPLPALVDLDLTTDIDNPSLCPGEKLTYTLTLDISTPTVVDIDASVKSVDTQRTVISSITVRNIYDEAGKMVIQSDFTLPRVLPATANRPEQFWTSGQYKRLLSVMSVEGDRKASVVSIPFIVDEDCANVIRS